MKQTNDVQDILAALMQIVGNTQNLLGLITTFIDSKTIYNAWISGDYFSAGLYTGKGIVGVYFTGYSIIYQYL